MMKRLRPSITAAFLVALFAASPAAHAITLTISAPALERTLRTQLFTTPGPSGKPERHYLKGSPTSACATFVDDPHITFQDDRVVVKLRTHARLGTALHGACLGLSLTTETEVSLIPVAEGESIGFRDARIDHLSGNPELNFLLEPFLARKLPAEMKMNAAQLMRQLLVRAPDQTGYTLTLTSLKLHSMSVLSQSLLVDLDANIQVD